MAQTTAGQVVSGTVVNSDIAVGASIEASKLQHQSVLSHDFGLDIDDTPVTKEILLFIARGASTIKEFAAVFQDTGTASNIDFQLKVNGSTVLTSDLNFTNSDTDLVAKSGTLASASLTAGDVVSCLMTVTTSTDCHGPLVQVAIDHPYVS